MSFACSNSNEYLTNLQSMNREDRVILWHRLSVDRMIQLGIEFQDLQHRRLPNLQPAWTYENQWKICRRQYFSPQGWFVMNACEPCCKLSSAPLKRKMIGCLSCTDRSVPKLWTKTLSISSITQVGIASSEAPWSGQNAKKKKMKHGSCENRTRDLLLTRETLCQLSQGALWYLFDSFFVYLVRSSAYL